MRQAETQRQAGMVTTQQGTAVVLLLGPLAPFRERERERESQLQLGYRVDGDAGDVGVADGPVGRDTVVLGVGGSEARYEVLSSIAVSMASRACRT